MLVPKATSRIRRLFASLDIHYNNIANTEMQKKMKLNKEASNKVVNSKIFEIPYLKDFFEFLPVVGIVEI